MATGKERLYVSSGGRRSTMKASEVGGSAPAATTTTAGLVKMAAAQTTFNGSDVAGINTQLNAFYAKLKTAGLVA